MDLEQDPFLIESWEQYAKDCIAANSTWRFRKTLCDYIWWTNRPLKAELKAYTDKRLGEWAKEDLIESNKVHAKRMRDREEEKYLTHPSH